MVRDKPCNAAGAKLTLVLLLALVACDPVLTVRGKVRDINGTPLQNVTVLLETTGRAPHKSVTGADGSFTASMVGAEPGDTKIVFELQGYKTVERPLGDQHASVIELNLEHEANDKH